MGFEVDLLFDSIEVRISGLDALLLVRRRLAMPYSNVRDIRVEPRDQLEHSVDSRRLGVGTNSGSQRPGRKRLGVFTGRDVRGDQFWAVPSSASDARLVLVATDHDRFGRLVLLPANVDAFVSELRRQTSPPGVAEADQ